MLFMDGHIDVSLGVGDKDLKQYAQSGGIFESGCATQPSGSKHILNSLGKGYINISEHYRGCPVLNSE